MHYHTFMFSVMCKCSYIMNKDDTNMRRNKAIILPASTSSSSTSQTVVSTTFITSPRSHSQSPRRSKVRSTTRDEGRSGGSTPRRLFLPQLKGGKLRRRVTIGSTSSNGSAADVDEPDWPPFADEDYIVFCFEEDGAFHVVLEDSPRTTDPSSKVQCEDHGNVTCACTDENRNAEHLGSASRRDCLLPNEEAKEEGTDRIADGDLRPRDNIVLRNESMKCRNGSYESTDSSQTDWEESLQDEVNLEIRSILTPRNSLEEDDIQNNADLSLWRDYFSARKPDDEEEDFQSPESQLGMMLKIKSLLDNDSESSSTVSDQLWETNESNTKINHEEIKEEKEDRNYLDSAKSSVSDHAVSNSSSFEFPVLDSEWIGSPTIWPRSGGLELKKRRSRRICFTPCCRF